MSTAHAPRSLQAINAVQHRVPGALRVGRLGVFRDLPDTDAITTGEAADYLGVADECILSRIKSGEIPGTFKKGSRWRIDRAKFITWAEPLVEAHRNRLDFLKEQRVVYFIACADFVKIGFTEKLGLRLHAMRLHNPLPIKVLAALPGGKDLEYKMHQQFRDLSVGREWFRYEGALKEYVEGLAK